MLLLYTQILIKYKNKAYIFFEFLSQKETNKAIIIKIIVALFVVKKLPDVLKGKNSKKIIVKTGIIFSKKFLEKFCSL